MREVDAAIIVQRLAGKVADLTIQLAVAEAQLAAYERSEVDQLAAQEAADADR
jgi:hypothetical protein